MISQVDSYYPSTRRAVGPVSQTDRFYDDTRNDVRCPYAEGLEDMSGHLRRVDNPHGVTAEQVGAVREARVNEIVQSNFQKFQESVAQAIADSVTGHNANKDAHQAMQDALKQHVSDNYAAKAHAHTNYLDTTTGGEVTGADGVGVRRLALMDPKGQGMVFDIKASTSGRGIEITPWNPSARSLTLTVKDSNGSANVQAFKVDASGIYEGGTLLSMKYAPRDHTHADLAAKADVYTKKEVDNLIAQAVANAKTQLLEQLKTLYAPLSSVQATVGGTTYRWAWDDTFQTFAMKTVAP